MVKNNNNTKQNIRLTFLLTQDIESPSGLGRYFPLGKNLVNQGFSVSIAALHSNFQELKEKKFTKEGVKITYVGQMHVKKENDQTKYFGLIKLLWYSLVATWKLLIYILKNKADIIIIGKPHPMNSIAGLIGGKFHKAKIILDCDDYEAVSNYFSSRWQRWVIRWFENTMPKLVHQVITNTYFNKHRMIGLGVSVEKIDYLPNGVDRERFTQIDELKSNQIRKKYKLENQKVIAYIGSLSLVNHPVDLLIKAHKEIIKELPNIKLLIVGGGKDYGTLKSLVLEDNLVDDVVFTGRVAPEMVPYYYDIADITVDPVYDTDEAKGRCPLKLFESWAMNTPFVTADVGDRRTLAGNFRTYTLAIPGDHLDLAGKIIVILKDKGLASQLSFIYREKVEEYFWDRIVKNNLHIFN